MRLRGRDFEEGTFDGARDGAEGRSPIGMGHADTQRCSGWSPGPAYSWYLPCRRIRRQATAPSICSRMVAASAAVSKGLRTRSAGRGEDLGRAGPAGSRKACWIDPRSGEEAEADAAHHGSTAAVRLPAGWGDGLLVAERAEQPRVRGASG